MDGDLEEQRHYIKKLIKRLLKDYNKLFFY